MSIESGSFPCPAFSLNRAVLARLLANILRGDIGSNLNELLELKKAVGKYKTFPFSLTDF